MRKIAIDFQRPGGAAIPGNKWAPTENSTPELLRTEGTTQVSRMLECLLDPLRSQVGANQ